MQQSDLLAQLVERLGPKPTSKARKRKMQVKAPSGATYVGDIDEDEDGNSTISISPYQH